MESERYLYQGPYGGKIIRKYATDKYTRKPDRTKFVDVEVGFELDLVPHEELPPIKLDGYGRSYKWNELSSEPSGGRQCFAPVQFAAIKFD